jgi:ATP/maltotriose-dependent transcriptional regulator MalT
MGETDVRQPKVLATKASSELERARDCYEHRAWKAAYDAFSSADRQQTLGAGDLEMLALSAYLTGHDDEYLNALDRAHRAYLDSDDCLRASRCAFWCGLRLMFRGEMGPASGWLARAQRLIERQARECVEQGYMLVPLVQQHLDSGDWEAALSVAARAVEFGERFEDADLVAIARHLLGRILIEQGQAARGLGLLDEVMLSVTGGELSPLVTGLIYCSVIEGCQQVYAFGRAREWTSALARWCEEQPELVAFTGVCLVHRAEIMQIQGAWKDAITEAQRACERCREAGNKRAVGGGFYQLAELHRLHGDYAAAEQAYRSASEWGLEPQPGLALLRMAQGRTEAGAMALRRVMSVTKDPLQRLRLLPAYIEIMLATLDIEQAEEGCAELETLAQNLETSKPNALDAMATYARGSVELAKGDAAAALVSLRHAWRVWQEIDAPYLASRARVLIGLACRALDDEEGASLEWDAARSVFERLGAAPELDRVRTLAQDVCPSDVHGLTARELQVLRLLAAGKKNKVIAAELFVSERTIDRHVSSILSKLDLSSRSAATAYAYEHKLI